MLSRADARLIRGLQHRKIRHDEGLFLAEGARVVSDLLASPIVPRLAAVSSSMEDTSEGAALLDALRRRCRVERIDDAELDALAPTETPQGVLVVAEIPEATLADVEPGERSVGLMLDAVQDPGNFGTLARSADAFGIEFVIALPGTVDAWNPKSVRAAAGATFRLPVVASDFEAARAWLEREKFAMLIADADGTPVEVLERAPRTVLVLGNEGAGVGAEVRAAADGLVAVGIRERVDSLNVAIAGGILLYSLTRR